MNQPKSFLISAAVIVCVLVGAALSPRAMDAILIGLAIGVLVSPVAAYQCMSLSMIVKYLNPEIASFGSSSGMLFWVILIAGGLRLLLLRATHLRLVAPIWIFASIALSLSCFTSPVLSVSILKVVTLVIVATGVVCGFQALAPAALLRVKVWLFALASAVTALSVVTLVRHDIAYAVVATNFQGILNHPQTLGTFLSPFAAWSFCGIFMVRRRPRLVELAFLAAIWAVMLMTLARTAAIAAMIGAATAFFVRFVSGRRSAEQAGIGKLMGLSAAAVALLVVSIMTADALRASLTSFIFKREAQSIDEAFSRSSAIQSQWRNFLQKPLTGYGYGVYADGSFPDGVVEFAGIPISAPVEKGFIPTAVLEETGIFGAGAFLFFIFRLGASAFRSVDSRWIAAFSAALTVNIGEAVLLSPGGIGLHIWIFIAFAAAAYRLDEVRAENASSESSPAVDVTPLYRHSNLMR